MHVARDQQLEAAGQREDAAARAAAFLRVAGAALIVELDEIGADVTSICRPAVEIAGDGMAADGR